MEQLSMKYGVSIYSFPPPQKVSSIINILCKCDSYVTTDEPIADIVFSTEVGSTLQFTLCFVQYIYHTHNIPTL